MKDYSGKEYKITSIAGKSYKGYSIDVWFPEGGGKISYYTVGYDYPFSDDLFKTENLEEAYKWIDERINER